MSEPLMNLGWLCSCGRRNPLAAVGCECGRRWSDQTAYDRARAWSSGRLAHTEECQIHKTPPAGWPFGGFSCNCGGVER